MRRRKRKAARGSLHTALQALPQGAAGDPLKANAGFHCKAGPLCPYNRLSETQHYEQHNTLDENGNIEAYSSGVRTREHPHSEWRGMAKMWGRTA